MIRKVLYPAIICLCLLLSGCLNLNYDKIFPQPPTTEELLMEKQDGELANPFPSEHLNIDGVEIE